MVEMLVLGNAVGWEGARSVLRKEGERARGASDGSLGRNDRFSM